MRTPALNFGNDQILVVRNFDKMSRRIRWSEIEFSHSLSLEPTAFAPSVSRCGRRFTDGLRGRGSVLGR